MDKFEKKKLKTSNMAHLVSLVAIIALLVCLFIIICVRTAIKNKESKAYEAAINESIIGENEDEMKVELEHMQEYLKTLESAVEDSTLTLNTLYDTQGKKDQSQLEESTMKMNQIEERMNAVKENITKLIQIIDSNEEHDNGVIYENFTKVYKDVEGLKNDVDKVLNDLLQDNSVNHEKVLTSLKEMENAYSSLNKSMENNLTKNIEKMNNEFNISINKTNDTLNKSITEGNDVLSKNIIDSNTSLSKSIADGNTNLSKNIADGNSTLLKSIEDKNSELNKNIVDGNNDVKTYLGSIYDTLNSCLEALKNSMGGRFDKVDADLESVFQYVANGKRNIASSLVTIGTGMETDAQTGEYIVQTFDSLSDAIVHSQDINGTYEDDVQIYNLSGATENNLPKGAAAWVQGQYIKGNGFDIDNAYNNGHQKGYDEGYSDGLAKIYNAKIVYDYHHHEGNAGENGGCYTLGTHIHNGSCATVTQTVKIADERPCGCFYGNPTGIWPGFGDGAPCPSCNHAHAGGSCNQINAAIYTTVTNYACGNPINYYNLGCGLSEGQMVSAHIDFTAQP